MPAIDLAAVRRGSGAPLLLLHGFTTHSAAWSIAVNTLAPHADTICVDLPGHGRSSAPPAGYTFATCLNDLIALLDGLDLATCNVLGYSMGGRVALALAVSHPDRVDHLILESASPGIADDARRAARVNDDRRLATEIESAPLAPFIDRWMNLPIFRSTAQPNPARRARSRRLRLENRPRAIAAALRALGTGSQDSYWDALAELDVPVLLITGEVDEKFQRINDDMHARLPRSTRRVIAGAGHTTHLDQPEAFVEQVKAFLLEPEPRERSATDDETRTEER